MNDRYFERGLAKHRKEAYEALHPETRVHVLHAGGINKALGNNVSAKLAPTFTAAAPS